MLSETRLPVARRSTVLTPPRLLLFAMLIYTLFVTAGAAFKQARWGYGFDMVDFTLPVWNTTQGRFLGISRFNFTDTFLGLDVALGFLPAVPFYALVPSSYTLIVLQTLLIASGALPVYLIARDKLSSRWAGLAWALAYLLYPTTQFVNMAAPFQPRVPGLLCLLWAFFFYQRGRLWPTLALVGLALLARSDAALLAIAVGFYALLGRRDWRWWLPPILLGAIYFYAAITYISPAFYSAAFKPVKMEVPFDLSRDYNELWPCGLSPQACYYIHLGGSLPAIAKNIITHPLAIAAFVFQPAKVEYLLLMLGTLLFFPLLAPRELLLAAPILAVNLLSTRPYQYVITEQYQILVIPGLLIAAIYGSARARGWLRAGGNGETGRRGDGETGRRGTSAFRLQNSSFALWLLLPLLVGLLNIPLKNPVISTFRNAERPERVALMERMKALIPPDAAVAATSFLGPHMIPRQQIYYIPAGKMHHQLDEAAYAFIDARATTLRNSGLVEALRADPAWELLAEEDDLLLFRKQ